MILRGARTFKKSTAPYKVHNMGLRYIKYTFCLFPRPLQWFFLNFREGPFVVPLSHVRNISDPPRPSKYWYKRIVSQEYEKDLKGHGNEPVFLRFLHKSVRHRSLILYLSSQNLDGYLVYFIVFFCCFPFLKFRWVTFLLKLRWGGLQYESQHLPNY